MLSRRVWYAIGGAITILVCAGGIASIIVIKLRSVKASSSNSAASTTPQNVGKAVPLSTLSGYHFIPPKALPIPNKSSSDPLNYSTPNLTTLKPSRGSALSVHNGNSASKHDSLSPENGAKNAANGTFSLGTTSLKSLKALPKVSLPSPTNMKAPKEPITPSHAGFKHSMAPSDLSNTTGNFVSLKKTNLNAIFKTSFKLLQDSIGSTLSPVFHKLSKMQSLASHAASKLTVENIRESAGNAVLATVDEIRSVAAAANHDLHEMLNVSSMTYAEQRARVPYIPVAALDLTFKPIKLHGTLTTEPQLLNQMTKHLALTFGGGRVTQVSDLDQLSHTFGFNVGLLNGTNVTSFQHCPVGSHVLSAHLPSASGFENLSFNIVGLTGPALAGIPLRALVVDQNATLGRFIDGKKLNLSTSEISGRRLVSNLLESQSPKREGHRFQSVPIVEDSTSYVVDETEDNAETCSVLVSNNSSKENFVSNLVSMFAEKFESAPGGELAMQSVMTKMVESAMPQLKCMKPGQTAVTVFNSEHIGPNINDLVVFEAKVDGVKEAMHVHAIRTAFTMTADGRLALNTKYVLYPTPIWQAIRDVMRESVGAPTTDMYGNDVSSIQDFTDKEKSYAKYLNALATNLIVSEAHLQGMISNGDPDGVSSTMLIMNDAIPLDCGTAAVKKVVTNAAGQKIELIHTHLKFDSPDLFRPAATNQQHSVPVLIAGGLVAFASERVIREAVAEKFFTDVQEAAAFCGTLIKANEHLQSQTDTYDCPANKLFEQHASISGTTEHNEEITIATTDDVAVSVDLNSSFFTATSTEHISSKTLAFTVGCILVSTVTGSPILALGTTLGLGQMAAQAIWGKSNNSAKK